MLASTTRRSVIALLLGCFLLPTTALASEWIYTVVPGDNLWTFSEKHLDSATRFEELRRINNIENPTRMRPGTRIRVPMDWVPRSQAVPAIIEAVAGSARLARATGDKVDARAGMEVRLGDRVRTGNDSSAAIRFADESVLTLHEDSEVRFDQLAAYGETGMVDSRFKLMEGRLDTRVTPAAGPGSRFEIHTPSAISAVRGTEYRATAEAGTEISNIEVLEGGVVVTGQGTEEVIPSGFGTRVEKGKPPIPPRELLPAPGLQPLASPVRSLESTLRWGGQNKAIAYRVELSDAPGFDTIRWDEKTSQTKIALPELADGSYHVRVRGIDEIGLEGLAAVTTLDLDARPFPPEVREPQDGAILRNSQPQLQWLAESDAAGYHLQVATDATFKDIVVDRNNLTRTRFSDNRLNKAGRYHWRVTSIDSSGEAGPDGTVQSFSVKPAAGKLNPSLNSAYEGKVMASWPPAPAGLSYQAQVSQDSGFRDLEVDVRSDDPKLLVDADEDHTRYFRVRAVGEDGYAGPWSDPQSVERKLSKHTWFIPIAALLVLIAL